MRPVREPVAERGSCSTEPARGAEDLDVTQNLLRFAVALTLLVASLGAAPPAPPAGGVPWSAGSQHVLTWDAARFPAGAPGTLELSADGGKSWAEAGRATNTGRLVGTIPDRPSASCPPRAHVRPPAPAAPR